MKKGEVKRGFNQMRKMIRDRPSSVQYIANCLYCLHYDEEKGCTNGNVTLYDVVQDGDREFCSYWSGVPYDNGRKKKDEMDDWLNTF